MQRILKFRIPALFCAFAVLACELISHPFAEMGISDDPPYVVMAQHLAATGHLAYNGWATAMLGWQIYLAAAFIKLFGFSFTTVRMSTLLIAVLLAFFLQRTLVRTNISERNATIGTLALVLCPLYLMLSATFMTDIQGLFALVLCLYGCLRALQTPSSRAAIAWLCFAVAINSICGTSRQIAWLGTLVMVPSTLWLLRSRRSIFIAGAIATLAGALFILACMLWLAHQPYTVPEHLFVKSFPLGHTIGQLIHTYLDIPFLILPLFAIFLPQIRNSSRRVLAAISIFSLAYILLAIHLRHSHPDFLLEPTQAAQGGWVGLHGIHEGTHMLGDAPLFLHPWAQILFTIASIGGVLGLVAALLRARHARPHSTQPPGLTWPQLAVLVVPFALAYAVLLIPRATDLLFDRYTMGLLLIATILLVRFYQDYIQTRLPITAILLVAIMAVYGVAVTHNMFALYRARVQLAAEFRAAGIPDTSVDNGWEYNFTVELQHAPSINSYRMSKLNDFYHPAPPPPPGPCPLSWYDYTPHIHPLYGVAYDPNMCYGPAPFAPVQYSRWLSSTPGTIYAVRYTLPTKP